MSFKVIEDGTINAYEILFVFYCNWPYLVSFPRQSERSKIVIFSYLLIHNNPMKKNVVAKYLRCFLNGGAISRSLTGVCINSAKTSSAY